METYNGIKLDKSLSKEAKDFIKSASKRKFSCDSIKIDEARYGSVKMSAQVLLETTNPYGMIHGGILFMLADSVAGLTSISMGKKVVTLSSNISFIKSAKKGFVHASPKILHNGKSTILIEVEMIDDFQNLISKATFNMFVIGEIKDEEVDNE